MHIIHLIHGLIVSLIYPKAHPLKQSTTITASSFLKLNYCRPHILFYSRYFITINRPPVILTPGNVNANVWCGHPKLQKLYQTSCYMNIIPRIYWFLLFCSMESSLFKCQYMNLAMRSISQCKSMKHHKHNSKAIIPN